MSGGIGPLALIGLLGAGLLHLMGMIPVAAFNLVFVLSLAISLVGSLPRFGVGEHHTRLVAGGFCVAGLGLVLLAPDVAVVPYLAIALAYVQLTYVFAHGLMPGRQPVLEQLIRLMAMLPDGTAEFWRFVRGQCQLWSLIGAAMTLAALAAMLLPEVRDVAVQALTALTVLQLSVFIISHLYARWRYGRPETWQATLKAMSHPAIWSKLRL